MSTRWVTSDTHFFHKSILNWRSETRPWSSVEEMNEALVDKWNSNVQPKDTIYHLGDFSFGSQQQTVDILKQLNGIKVLIFGNHDKVMRRYEVMKYFHETYDYKEISVEKTKICLFHFPIFEWNGAHRGSLHCHGHLHSSRVWGRSKDVGCESNDCNPYNLEDLMMEMKKLPIKVSYHDVK